MVSELLEARTHPSGVCDTLLCHAAMSPAMTVCLWIVSLGCICLWLVGSRLSNPMNVSG